MGGARPLGVAQNLHRRDVEDPCDQFRPFRNDTERLEHLFKLYAARVKKLKKGAAA